ncbi:MAG TPA: SDR family oxidoreductase [Dysgonamonadaceae bacterium]|nr:SDR family oxidoreductase [Dysgonamonadaceae bacterium]
MTRKHIIITGGAQGIGRVMAEEFLKNDYNVSIFDIDSEAMEEIRPHFDKRHCEFFITDVSNQVSVRSSIRASLKKFDAVYGLINNAIFAIFKPMSELTLEEWNRAISTNLTGTFLCSKFLIPYLKESNGCIINMCSTRAFQSEPDTESYSASKGGIYALTHSMAISLGPDIRVNCISPGWIDVSAIKKSSKAKPEKLTREDHAQHPAGRVGNPLDIARMALFLLDPANSFITGQNFIVDGGMTRKMIYV